MDKILRRVRMAERQVARRVKRNQEKTQAAARKKRLEEIARLRRSASLDLNSAIKARHEDLELGPIAPRRDVSQLTPSGAYWGSIAAERLNTPKLTDEQKSARAAWAGGVQYLCLAPGDRVVVLEGPDKGKIATIDKIDRDTMSVELGGADIGFVNAMLPDFLAKQGGKPVVQVKASIPISAIRLVHPITDPQTGVTRDTIIRELQPVGMVHDRPTRKVFWSRLVPGLNVRIPWPKVPPKKHEDYPADTLRLEVEERTFVPTLLRPPMPETVIDELRNRYSKFRTRHTPEYIAKIEAQEAGKKVRKQSVESMLLPVQEYNRKLRELRRQRGKPELTTEMLEKIGEIIVKNKLRRSGDQLTEAGAATTDAQMGRIQSAVAQLSIGAETPGASSGEEQPRA